MPSGSAEDTLKLILKALELSHQRGILLSGWAGIGEERTLPEYAFGIAERSAQLAFFADEALSSTTEARARQVPGFARESHR